MHWIALCLLILLAVQGCTQAPQEQPVLEGPTIENDSQAESAVSDLGENLDTINQELDDLEDLTK